MLDVRAAPPNSGGAGGARILGPDQAMRPGVADVVEHRNGEIDRLERLMSEVVLRLGLAVLDALTCIVVWTR